ncbi:MAG: hypothetical protein HXX11_07305 [Desulfuromonadales bacterium]|nr:hypothetical protein [Desulfuromonadales bacterium]
MKQYGMTVLCLMIVCISGCAQSLPPREELNQAVKMTFDTTGLNYSSRSRITNLSLSKQGTNVESGDKLSTYLGTGLEIARGFSVNVDGAIDMKAKKAEVLYDLRYDKDNVEVSIKIPLLIDYTTQTMYVGTSIFNTILESLYPRIPAARGRLFKINLNELLREGSADMPELSKLVTENRFTPKSIESINNAVKASVLKTMSKLNDTCLSYQPLTEQDKQAGVVKRIQVNLGHSDSVNAVMDLVDGVLQALYQDAVITKKEYAVLLTMTDRQELSGIIEKFTIGMIMDVGIAQSGFVSQVASQIQVAEKGGGFQLGLDNVSSFSSYNAPRFSLNPGVSGVVDFKEVLDVIKADMHKEKNTAKPSGDSSQGGEDSRDAPEKQ